MNARHVASALTTIALAGAECVVPPGAYGAEETTQTIVMVRHGEKPAEGLGQLSCQGLNRALALPRVIKEKFGRPDAIFAPDPAKQKNDHGIKYDYVRPLATIEPTAIYFGLPVDASIGFRNADKLADALLSANFRSSVVVIAWEHAIVEQTARGIVKRYGGDAASVPKWASADFDSIYVVRITRRAGASFASFTVEQEGLNDQPSACPVH